MPTSDDDREVDAKLGETLYEKLHEVARSAMRSERVEHTLQPTALIHEAYIKLAKIDDTIVDDDHFLALAALQMRRVLVDSARSRKRQKRRPPEGRVLLQGGDDMLLEQVPDGKDEDVDEQVLNVDRALQQLEAVSPRRAELVVLRFFGGLSVGEAARVLGLSERTATRDWKLAKLFLQRVLAEE
jgi:RNA polymerase sigma factor (TIGR02999 family)